MFCIQFNVRSYLKDYVYPNDNGPRTDWYHDHGIHSTVCPAQR